MEAELCSLFGPACPPCLASLIAQFLRRPLVLLLHSPARPCHWPRARSLEFCNSCRNILACSEIFIYTASGPGR